MDNNETNDQLTAYIMKLIECKARWLIGKGNYTSDDLEDIAQDLYRDLLERLPKFNPTKAKMSTFADRVVGRRLRNLLRDCQAKCRSCHREVISLDEEIEIEESMMERHELVDEDKVALRFGRYNRPAEDRGHLQIDLDAVLADLPTELRQVAEMLSTQSVAEVSRTLGIPRRTLRCKYMKQLRAVFAAHRLDEYMK